MKMGLSQLAKQAAPLRFAFKPREMNNPTLNTCGATFFQDSFSRTPHKPDGPAPAKMAACIHLSELIERQLTLITALVHRFCCNHANRKATLGRFGSICWGIFRSWETID